MALVRCKECGAEISTKAVSCPKCGAVRKAQAGRTGCLTWVIAFFVVAGVIGAIIESAVKPSKPTASEPTSAEQAKAQADRQRERDLQLAERKKQFALQRGSLIARVKQLNAAGKYSEALELGSQWLALDPELDAQTDIARAKMAAQTERVERLQKKKKGVSIGMTKQEVLESSWGKPQSINSTHTAAGTHEQWVYSGGYLYFDNGVLTAIQN